MTAGGDLGPEDRQVVGAGGSGCFALTGTDFGRMWIWLLACEIDSLR